MNLYDGARLQALRQPVIEYIRSRYDTDFTPEDETQAGEYYIDTIGVAPHQQGRGTGTRLLQVIIDEYVHRRRETLGLLVDEANPNAHRLYARLGFRRAGTKFLFGKFMEHLQLKG